MGGVLKHTLPAGRGGWLVRGLLFWSSRLSGAPGTGTAALAARPAACLPLGWPHCKTSTQCRVSMYLATIKQEAHRTESGHPRQAAGLCQRTRPTAAPGHNRTRKRPARPPTFPTPNGSPHSWSGHSSTALRGPFPGRSPTCHTLRTGFPPRQRTIHSQIPVPPGSDAQPASRGLHPG